MADKQKPTSAGNWRGSSSGRPAKKTASTLRRSIALLIVGMLGIVGIVVALALVIVPKPQATLAGFWVTKYADPRLPVDPTSEADRSAIRSGAYFGEVGKQVGESWPKVVEVLKSRKPKEPVIVYVSAAACLSETGDVLILPDGANLETRLGWLTLQEVLNEVKACKSKDKLLILDIMRPLADPSIGFLTQDIAGRVNDEVDSVTDPDRLTLLACSPGEVSLSSEPLGRSIFNYYVEEGLRGWADEKTVATKDGVVRVRELADYVKARVGDWAFRARNASQTPLLLGAPEADFRLVVVPTSGPKASLADDPKIKAKLDTDEAKTAEASKDAPKKDAAATPASLPADYPKWLIDGWNLSKRWADDRAARIAPRPLARLNAALLKAEREWRFGRDVEQVQADFAGRKTLIERQYASAIASHRPNPLPTVGLELGLKGVGPKAALVAASQELFKARNTVKDPQPLIKDFLTKNPVEGEAELAAALFDALGNLPRDQTRVYFDLLKLADDTLRAYRTQANKLDDPAYAETQLLQALIALAPAPVAAGGANAAAPPAATILPWPNEVLRKGFEAVRRGERLEAQADAFPWIRGLIDQAALKRHVAVVLLKSPGYVASSELEGAWKQSIALDNRIVEIEAAYNEARQAFDASALLLPAYQEYLERLGNAELLQAWNKVAAGATELASTLLPPSEKEAMEQWGREDFTTSKVEEWRSKAQSLQIDLEALRAPFSAAAVDALVNSTKGSSADSAKAFAEIDALLALPFLPVDSRLTMIDAMRRLDRGLHKKHFDAMSFTSANVSTTDARLIELKKARDRADRSIALLAFGGIDVSPLDEARRNLADKLDSSTRLALNKVLWPSWKDLPAKLQGESNLASVDRLGRIVPASMVTSALDNQETAPPTTRLRNDREAMLWAWMADFYRYLSKDLYASPFVKQESSILDSFAANVPARAAIQLAKDSAVRDPVLTPRDPSGKTSVSLTLSSGSGDDGKPSLRVLPPTDPRLVASPGETSPALVANQPVNVPIRVELRQDAAAANPADTENSPATPKGFLLEAKIAGRPFFYRAEINVGAALEPLRLILTDDSKAPTLPKTGLTLRTIQANQPFYLYVNNPTDKPHNIEVRLFANGSDTPYATSKIVLAAKQVRKVDSFLAAPLPLGAQPPTVPGTPPVELTSGLVVQLVDTDLPAADPSAILDEIKPTIDLVAPGDLVEVVQPQFVPGHAGNGYRNKLSVKVRAKTALVEGPCAVSLVLLPDLIPGYKGLQQLTLLGGTLKAVGDEVTLSAQGLEFADVPDERGTFLISVDGDGRALKYQVNFARQGVLPLAATLDTKAAFSLKPPLMAPVDSLYQVTIAVDNPPDLATLVVGLVRDVDGKSTLPDAKEVPARSKRIVLTADPKGMLLFKASIGDQVVSIDPKGVHGPVALQAGLTVGGKNVLAPKQFGLIFDGPPQNVEIRERTLLGGNILSVGASGTSPSGISSVRFFLGKPLDKKVPDEKGAVQGSLQTDGTWSARLALPKDAQGKVDIGVEFTNRLNLKEFDTVEFKLPASMAGPMGNGGGPGGADKPTTGQVTGTVAYGELKQPKLAVVVYNAKLEEVKRGTTDDKGVYLIEKLPPGAYWVYAIRDELNAKATEKVIITEGKTETVDLGLR